MKRPQVYWLAAGIVVVVGLVILGAVLLAQASMAATMQKNPWDGVPQHPTQVNHSDLIAARFKDVAPEAITPQAITRACLECHPQAAQEVMATTHWTWQGPEVQVPWREEPVTIGKINQLNNFCISAQANQKDCMSCHIGHGWQETEDFSQAFDFSNPENVDCLICHAQSGYAKGDYGNPAEFVDLVAAAGSVGSPSRKNCGSCHFNGGGGNNVKHGDLAEQLYFPSPEMDVHMGANHFLCTDCHHTTQHQIKGRLVADNYQIDPAEQVQCTDCHAAEPHRDQRLNAHTDAVACQTCHIPYLATKDPTKMVWDWRTAGADLGDNHFTYLKIKGSFQYESNVEPTYLWFNGNLAYRYLLGDPIDPTKPTYINLPAGDVNDPHAKIFPFKVHRAMQPYDTTYKYLLAPVTAGKDGYWTHFDWDQAFRLAEARMGLPYSGHYDFAETWMYWPTTHLVQPAEYALQCSDCHSENGRLDWESLGYPGDPLRWGGRK